MTDHQSRVFCNTICHNEFWNRNKRHLKQLETKRILQNSQETMESASYNILKTDRNLTVRSSNLQFLDGLSLGEKGSEFDIAEFSNEVYDLEVYDELLHLDNESKYRFVRIGDYSIYWSRPGHFLINKNSK